MVERFSIERPGLIVFFSDSPGSYVSMRGPHGENLKFRRDVSEFHDTIPSYAWAFEYIRNIATGDHFTFATNERTVVGEVLGTSEVRIVGRTGGGSPVEFPKRSATPPRVSFIMLTHNRLDFLPAAFESLRCQDAAVEVVVVDSSDNPVRDAVEHCARDIQVIYLYERPVEPWPPFVSRLWNTGIDASTGDLIAFLDDDDMKHPQFCARMVGALGGSDVALCCGRTVHSDSSRDGRLFSTPSLDRGHLLAGGLVTTGQMLLRRSVFDRVRFDSELPVSEDFDFALSLSEGGFPYIILDEDLTYYRVHDTSTSRDERTPPITQIAMRRLLAKHGVIDDRCSRCRSPVNFGAWFIGRMVGGTWHMLCPSCDDRATKVHYGGPVCDTLARRLFSGDR